MTKSNQTLAYEAGWNSAIAASRRIIKMQMEDLSVGIDIMKIIDGALHSVDHHISQLAVPQKENC